MSGTITADRLREILHYDPETGVFTWIAPLRRGWSGRPAGRPETSGHIVIGIDRRIYRAHRLAWLYMTGEWPAHDIDHRDTDRTNNKWVNLREATNAQNQWNVGLRRNNKSGFKGVNWWPKRAKWSASIKAQGKRHSLGYFDTPEAAHAAYVAAAERLHGEFARAA